MTDNRPDRTRIAAMCAVFAVLGVVSLSVTGIAAPEATPAVSAASATMEAGRVIESGMAGKFPRRAKLRQRVARPSASRHMGRRVLTSPAAPGRVRGFDLTHRLPPGTSASGRRNELDHMGAYNFTIDIE